MIRQLHCLERESGGGLTLLGLLEAVDDAGVSLENAFTKLRDVVHKLNIELQPNAQLTQTLITERTTYRVGRY